MCNSCTLLPLSTGPIQGTIYEIEKSKRVTSSQCMVGHLTVRRGGDIHQSLCNFQRLIISYFSLQIQIYTIKLLKTVILLQTISFQGKLKSFMIRFIPDCFSIESRFQLTKRAFICPILSMDANKQKTSKTKYSLRTSLWTTRPIKKY